MAEPIKSALFLDYDSLRRRIIGAADETAAARLAERSTVWVAAIEAGDLMSPPGRPRRVLLRRCYADPAIAAGDRDALAEAGFDIVERPQNKDDGGAAPLQMAIDVAATAAGTGHDEFILLASDADLTTLIAHLKTRNISSATYGDGDDGEDDRKGGDAVVDGKALTALLAAKEAPVVPERPVPAIDRAAVEAFARRIHAATKVPLFSPKAFGELFRHLTDEIAANGYHFQSTAENVAARMAESGRSVTRRQVVFVVKGLALKGHVFSTSDTPERLAEVFREQVVYLARNAGITFEGQDEELLTAWICSRAGTTTDRPSDSKPKAADASDKASDKRRTDADMPAKAEEKPTTKAAEKAADKAATDKPRESKPDSVRLAEERKAAIAARIAAAAKPLLRSANKPGSSAAKPASPAKSAPKTAAAPPPPTDDQIESSILAAIAEAVDVLVEDSGGGSGQSGNAGAPAAKKSGRQPSAAKKNAKPAVEERPDPVPSDGGNSDDIGDEIQRIIASYHRNRKKDDDG